MSQAAILSELPLHDFALNSEDSEWYVVHTRARHEMRVAKQLQDKRITTFVPTVRQIHQWSDRKKIVEVPLFSCYVFVQAQSWRTLHLSVLTTPGVLQWVRSNGEPATIPASQIEAVRAVASSRTTASPYPFLKQGQRVRICGGCLDGVEGLLVGTSGDSRLVVSIHAIQQSIAVTLEGYHLTAA